MTQIAADCREVMDEFALADFLGLTVATLRKWRYLRSGPQFVKLGGKLVRYRREDVERWLAARTVPTGAGEVA